MIHNRFYPNLQPKHGQNGIGNLEHGQLIPYLIQNRKLNGGPDREKKMQKKRAKDRLKHRMIANVGSTRFEIVKNVLEDLGFTLQDTESIRNSYLIWADSFISQDRLTELKSYQRLNHFLGMGEISRKDYFAKKFAKMQKLRPKEYSYFPKTWLFPQERNVFQKYLKETKDHKKRKYFIIKPANGAMGVGIKLVSEDDPIKVQDASIVQEYIDRPFLLDGYKNDLRIYVLVTCCDPLRAFIYREGLVRLGTEKYVLPNDLKSESHFMHLTNYSVNKRNSKYSKVQDDGAGSKRSLSYLMEHLHSKYKINTELLWRQITDIVVKTLLLAQPHLLHNYRMCRPGQLPVSESVCFEILGFDILLDEFRNPWLIEVNRSPSFGVDEMLDRKLKTSLLEDTLHLLNIKPSDKVKHADLQKQRATKRLTLAAVRSRVDTQLSHEFMKKRKEIDKKKQDLIDQLVKARASSSREYYENKNVGKFMRIFPPEDKTLQLTYLDILTDSFVLFNQQSLNSGGSANSGSNGGSGTSNTVDPRIVAKNQAEVSIMINTERDELLVEQIKECEDEENMILNKFHLPPNAALTTLIPNINFYDTDSASSCSSSEDSDSSSGSEQSVPKSNNSHGPLPSSREFVAKRHTPSPQEGQPSLRQFQTQAASVIEQEFHREASLVKTSPKVDQNRTTSSKGRQSRSTPSSGNSNKQKSRQRRSRTSSVSSSSSSSSSVLSHKKVHQGQKKKPGTLADTSTTDPVESFIESRSKNVIGGLEIYNELLKIILTGLNNIAIRYPGQEDCVTKTMVLKMQNSWDLHRQAVASYWLVNLNARKRQKVLGIVRASVDAVLQEQIGGASHLCESSRLTRLLDKLYNRLLWNRGHGLMQCFSNFKSWKLIFSGSSSSDDQLRPLEVEVCSRIVQLCLNCVLIVYQFSLTLAAGHVPTATAVSMVTKSPNSMEKAPFTNARSRRSRNSIRRPISIDSPSPMVMKATDNSYTRVSMATKSSIALVQSQK